MKLLPTLLRASPAELAAFRAQMRSRYRVPARASAEKVDRAFEILADRIVAYLSSPIPSAPDPDYRVGPCIGCGKLDCYATAEPWAAPLVYRNGKAWITGGFCCAIVGEGDKTKFDQTLVDRCAHPMLER